MSASHHLIKTHTSQESGARDGQQPGKASGHDGAPQILYNKLLYQVSFREFCCGECSQSALERLCCFDSFTERKKKGSTSYGYGEN